MNEKTDQSFLPQPKLTNHQSNLNNKFKVKNQKKVKKKPKTKLNQSIEW